VAFIQQTKQSGVYNDTWDDATVWITSSSSSSIQDVWKKAVVVSKVPPDEGEEWEFKVREIDSGNTVSIRTPSLGKQGLEYVLVKRRDEGLKGSEVHDMTSLLYLNAPELLECVKQRYMEKSIYTSIGPILLAVNPFERLPLYSSEILNKYNVDDNSLGQKAQPHVFEVANRAYSKMFVDKFRPDERENQSILVNGESGAGKTESTKHVLHFLAVVSSKVASQCILGDESNQDIENQILASNPILESFGNAKTLRNNNSSRFGKFIELLYTSDGYIEGAVMRTYLLETMRVVGQGTGERNYHIFYEVFAGLAPAVKKRYGLTDLAHFRYTNQSGELCRHDGESDLENFGDLKDALTTLEVDEDFQDDVDKVIAGILHLGNLSFEDSSKAGEDAADFSPSSQSRETVDFVCQLLGLHESMLLSAVARRSVTVVGNTIEKTLNSESAVHARDSFAKFLYSALFAWVVAKMNVCLVGDVNIEETASFIGVLDIFGFEHFDQNSFEQLCINYTNEKLQDHFNYSVFRSEQEVYQQEGLKWTFVEYPDNSARLDLIEHSSVGILAICNEQLKMPKCTDEKLAQSLYQKCGTHTYFRATRAEKGKLEFTILHYACPVTYQTEGFLDKNRTENPKELYDTLRKSRNALMREMYGECMGAGRTSFFGDMRSSNSSMSITQVRGFSRQPSNRSVGGGLTKQPSAKFNIANRSSPKPSETTKSRQHRSSIGKKVTSLSSQFQTQLSELMGKIRSTRSHFICCIKPNRQMQAGVFDSEMCADQIRCGGSLGALQVFKAGFANRLSFAAFTNRFSAFAFVSGTNMLTRDLQSAIELARTTGSLVHWRRAAGCLLDIVPLSHMVLSLALNEPPDCEVDIVRDMQMGKTQIFLKAEAFEFLERLHLRTRNLTARRLQLRWRAWRVSKHNENLGIKTTSGMLAAQEAMRYFSDFRRIQAMKKVSATIVLQRRARIFLAVHYRKLMLSRISNFQRHCRRYLEWRREMRSREAAVRVVQHYIRGLLARFRWLRFHHAVIRLQCNFRGKTTRKRLRNERNAQERGMWCIVRLQSLARGQAAREKFHAIRRAMISKRFEDQMKAQMRKKEILAKLEAKLEEDPHLLDTLEGSSGAIPPSNGGLKDEEIQRLRNELTNLQLKVKSLEEENHRLKAQLEVSAVAASGDPTGHSVSMWLERVEKLERENLALKKGNPGMARSRSSFATARGSFVGSADDPSSKKGGDAKEVLRRRLSATSSANAVFSNDDRLDAVTLSANLLSSDKTDKDMESQHPDWIKKFSDQHKRVYWRHKVTGKTTWTAPVLSTSKEVGIAEKRQQDVASNAAPSARREDTEDEGLSVPELQIAIEKLMSGWVGLKLSSTNYPKERTISVDPTTQILAWKKTGGKMEGCLNLDTVKRITRGKKSRTLEKSKGLDASLCLSVHYLKTSLDLQLASEAERDMMYFGLKELLKVE